jgi:predicted house-cleaning noncanonical NTP pyrophosphatase (MazG superfamily)
MSNQNVADTHVSQLELQAAELRELLKEARNSDDAERVHVALIETIEALIEQLGKHARLIEDLRSDMTHKQGIVTKIGGGDYES